jgi:two-component sensor histidine kinase
MGIVKTGGGKAHPRTSLARRQGYFFILAGVVAAASVLSTLAYALLGKGIRLHLAALGLGSLASMLLCVTGRYKRAVLCAEILFALAIAWEALAGVHRSWGVALAFLPGLIVFGIYFGDRDRLDWPSAWSIAVLVAWFFLVPGRRIGLNDSLTAASGIAFYLLLAGIVSGDLRFAFFDKESLLMELHHRVRNVLQICFSLSRELDESPDGASPEALGHRIRTLLRVQEEVAKSPDLRTVDMASLLSSIAADVQAEAGRRISIRAREGSVLAVELASPVSLIAAETMDGLARAPSGEALAEFSVDSGRARLSLSLGSPAGPLPFSPAEPSPYSLALLRQLRAAVSRPGGAWVMEFDLSSGPSFIDEGAPSPRPLHRPFLARSRPGLYGKANRGSSSGVLRKARALAGLLIVVIAVATCLILVSAATGSAFRSVSASISLVSLALFAVLRKGHARIAALGATAGFTLIISLSVFVGQGSAFGIPLFYLPVIVLCALYFLGPTGALVSCLWCVALQTSWFFLYPGRLLPTPAAALVLGSFLAFAAIALLLAREFGEDIGVKEALAAELRRRLRDDLALLEEVLRAPGPGDRAKSFRELARDMAMAHELVAGAPDMGNIEMAALLEGGLDRYFTDRGIARSRVAVEATGTLTAEKALPLLLVALRVGARACPALRAEGACLSVSLRSSGRHARLAISLKPSEPALDPDGEGSLLRMLESQLGAERGPAGPGAYSISFPC